MKKTIYIFSDGALKRKQNTLYFKSQKGQRYIPVENTNEIMIFGEVEINKKLLELLSQKEILLHYFNHYGYYMGSFYPREHYNSGYMILKQAIHYEDKEKRMLLAKKFVEGALQNMRRVLLYYNSRGVELKHEIEALEKFLSEIDKQTTPDALMAQEGNAKEVYYQAFDKIIGDEEFLFLQRSRRPPQNRLNALLSFGNSMLYTIILSEIYKTHLDPRIGFLHATNFRRFTLNLDVAEVFKPIIVDRCIFYLLNKKMIKPLYFEEHLEGIYLKEKGRAIFVEEFDRRLKTTVKLPSLRRNVSYRTLIRCELYKIEKHLLGEKEYAPFIATW